MKKIVILFVLLFISSSMQTVCAETTMILKYVESQLKLEQVAGIARDYIRSHEAKAGRGEKNEDDRDTLSILLKNVYYGHDGKFGLWYVEAICKSGAHYTICIDESNANSWLQSADRYFGADAIQPPKVNLPKWRK